MSGEHDPLCPKQVNEKSRCQCPLIRRVRAEMGLPVMGAYERAALDEMRGKK